MKRRILWFVVGALMLVGVVVFFLAWDAERAVRLIDNPTAILGGVISALGVVLAAVLPALLRVEKVTGLIRDNVQNGHKVPLRQEQDDRHEELMLVVTRLGSGIDNLSRRLDGQASDIRGIRKDIGRTLDWQEKANTALGSVEKRVREIEHHCCPEEYR